MRTSKKEKHPSILETVHETAKGLYDANIINATTMREFDEMCLPKIKQLLVFAKFLNTTLSTARQWEQGDKHPRGASLRLLNLIDEKGVRCSIVKYQ